MVHFASFLSSSPQDARTQAPSTTSISCFARNIILISKCHIGKVLLSFNFWTQAMSSLSIFIAIIMYAQRTEDLSILGNSFAGCLAAFFSSFTLCPTELVKCRLQALNEVNAAKRSAQLKNVNGAAANSEAATKLLKDKIGPFKLTKQILIQEGIPGLFRGLTSTIAREMPGYFFFFGGYEASRQMLAKEGQSKDDIGPLKTMLAGGIGGFTFWLVIFPADVIKSRIQVAGSKEPLMKVFLDIYKKEGLPALYNGLKPTLVRTVPATAALFLVYENTKKVLHSLFD